MSTHALGNVQLITVQEVEAMLDEVIVPETSIDAKVAAEAAAREAADTALTEKITAVKQMEEASDSNFHFSRLRDLPIATLYIDTRNITFKRSDANRVLTTVPAHYLPKNPVDIIACGTVLYDESSGEPTGGLVILHIDTNGDIKVIATFPFDGSVPAGTGSATATYITKE